MIYLGSDPVGITTSIPKFADIAKIEVGEYTPEQDELIRTMTPLTHSLGVVPDFILVYTDPISREGANWPKTYLHSSHAVPYQNSTYFDTYYQVTEHVAKINSTTTSVASATTARSYVANELTFIIPIYDGTSGTTTLKGGITYHYVMGKFKEVTPNA